VFFESVGLPWQYEIVGFAVGRAWYLPDFFLPTAGAHIEIKPQHLAARESDRVAAMQAAWENDGRNLWLIRGVPSRCAYEIRRNVTPDIGPAVFADCRRCDGICIAGEVASGYIDAWGPIGEHACGDHDREPLPDGPRVTRGYRMATEHKFDHYRHPDADDWETRRSNAHASANWRKQNEGNL